MKGVVAGVNKAIMRCTAFRSIDWAFETLTLGEVEKCFLDWLHLNTLRQHIT